MSSEAEKITGYRSWATLPKTNVGRGNPPGANESFASATSRFSLPAETQLADAWDRARLVVNLGHEGGSWVRRSLAHSLARWKAFRKTIGWLKKVRVASHS